MKKPKVIRFRCVCFECTGADEPTQNGPRSVSSDPTQHNEKSGEADLRLMPDAVGKLLFGA